MPWTSADDATNAKAALRAAAICITFLFLKMVHAAIKASGARVKAGVTFNKEDVAVLSKEDRKVEFKKDAGDVVDENYGRWKRIQMNDWENIPVTISLMLINFIVYAHPVAITVLICLFTFFRVAWNFCYAYEVQPWRTICWLLGLLCSVALGINAIVGAFKLP